MKKLFLLLFIATLFSCSKDNDTGVTEKDEVEVTNARWEKYESSTGFGDVKFRMKIYGTVTNKTDHTVTGKLRFSNYNPRTTVTVYLYSHEISLKPKESRNVWNIGDGSLIRQEQIDNGFKADFKIIN